MTSFAMPMPNLAPDMSFFDALQFYTLFFGQTIYGVGLAAAGGAIGYYGLPKVAMLARYDKMYLAVAGGLVLFYAPFAVMAYKMGRATKAKQ